MEINKDLAGRTLDRIIANPLEWGQANFCGSTFCYAGHALLIKGYKVNGWGNFVDDDGYGLHVGFLARQELGLTGQQADDIFYYFPEEELADQGQSWSMGKALRLMINRVAEVTGLDPAPYLAKVDIP